MTAPEDGPAVITYPLPVVSAGYRRSTKQKQRGGDMIRTAAPECPHHAALTWPAADGRLVAALAELRPVASSARHEDES